MTKAYERSTETVCRVCGTETTGGKQLTNHIKREHGLSAGDYSVIHLHGGVRPLCPICGAETRYVAFGFKRYCKDHSSVAESEGGALGGKAEAWNKGKTKESDERIAAYAASVTGSGNHFYGRTHSEETRKRSSNAHRLPESEYLRRIEMYVPDCTLLTPYGEYIDQNTPIKIRCRTCSTVSSVSLFNIMRCWRCRVCHPIGSHPQLELAQFIRGLGFDVELSTRSVIRPLELDVYVPEKKFAVEYHGLFWHAGGKDGDPWSSESKKKHRKKYLACRERGVKLVQLFSDEWRDRREIVESMLRHRLGISVMKVPARSCVVDQIVSSEARPFLDVSHIDGATRSTVYFGLRKRSDGSLMSIASLRKPIQKKWGNVIELSRYASSVGSYVQGGFSKLLGPIVKWSIEKGYEGLLTYADLRFGEGSVYSSCGLIDHGLTRVNYWYTDGVCRYDRFMYRAQDGMTERQYAESKGVRPIHGPGSRIYVMKF